jgi:hypothetical protein
MRLGHGASIVMAGLVQAIAASTVPLLMAGTGPAMTKMGVFPAYVSAYGVKPEGMRGNLDRGAQLARDCFPSPSRGSQ